MTTKNYYLVYRVPKDEAVAVALRTLEDAGFTHPSPEFRWGAQHTYDTRVASAIFELREAIRIREQEAESKRREEEERRLLDEQADELRRTLHETNPTGKHCKWHELSEKSQENWRRVVLKARERGLIH